MLPKTVTVLVSAADRMSKQTKCDNAFTPHNTHMIPFADFLQLGGEVKLQEEEEEDEEECI